MSKADSTNTTSVSGVGGEGLYLPTDVTPEQIFQEIGKLRKEARDEIDRLIGFLDKTDDYMFRELEDSIDDNPHNEETDDNGEDAEQCDPPEFSLGSLDHKPDQSEWSSGLGKDLEDEHDGAEPDEDGEPSLGAFEGHDDQAVAWNCDTYYPDNELDDAESSGIGDQDGLDEQVPFRDWQMTGMV